MKPIFLVSISATAAALLIALFFLFSSPNGPPPPPPQEIGDFEILVVNDDVSFLSDSVGSYSFSIRSLQGFDSSVRFRVLDPPRGIRIDFDGGPEYRVMSGQTLEAKVSFTLVEENAIGRRNITITAVSQTQTHSFSTTLDIIGQGTILLTVRDFDFIQDHVTVMTGTMVRWHNQDDVFHTVTSNEDFFDLPLNAQSVGTFQFTEEGTYSYFCRPHPWMLGTIQVIS